MSEPRPGLLPLLRSANQQRLLATLLLDPHSSFTVSELVAKTGVAQPTVSREVAQLVAASLLRVEVIRGRKEIRANTDSVIFAELASILLKTVGPKAVLERQLTGQRGVAQAFIYGSWARRYHGESGEEPGDIDVLVVGKPDVTAVRRRAEDASKELGRDVNISVLSEKEWTRSESGFLTQIRASPLVELDVTTKPPPTLVG